MSVLQVGAPGRGSRPGLQVGAPGRGSRSGLQVGDGTVGCTLKRARSKEDYTTCANEM